MSVAIVLPARLKSTRLPNKLLLSATGKTLLEHTIGRAKVAQALYPRLFTTIRVACDDEQLVAAAKRTGVDAVMTSPDHQSGTDRIAEAATDLKEEIIVNLQADEPEVDPEFLHSVSWPLTQTDDKIPGISSVSITTLATFIFDEATFKNPNVVKVTLANNRRALYFSRSPIPYPRDGDRADFIRFKDEKGVEQRVFGFHHIGIYGYRREFLAKFVALRPSVNEQIERLEQLRALDNGYAIQVSLMDSHVPGIDTQEDYEAFVARFKAKKSKGATS
jgi:3-deoxy-manno-octulosonate cytidylyltransferase (CMP-KDO synthetase)